MRKDEVSWAKASMKSIEGGLDKYAKGSDAEGDYLKEKMAKLDRIIKRIAKGGY